MKEAVVQAKVYVVDDDPGMLDSTVWLLESVGLQALPFTSGQAFLEACDGSGPLACCWMCACRGWAGWRCSRRCSSGLDMPVIFVSGHADVPIVVRAFKAGACDFIEKPYNDRLLLDSVQAALGRAGGWGGGRCRADRQPDAAERMFIPLVQGWGIGDCRAVG
jgi:FixJ family two-component response regulator